MKNLHRIKTALFLFLWSLGSNAQLHAQTGTAHILKNFLEKPDSILVAAHRGSHQSFPENSIPAFTAAYRDGAHILELDVRATKDGELVVMHDKTIDRTTNGKGAVKDLNYQELKQYRLLFNGQVTDQQIPSLRNSLLAVKDQILVDLDFKADGKQAVKDCYALIKELQMEEQVFFFTYNPKDAALLIALNPKVQVMPRVHNEKEVKKMLAIPQIKVVHIDPSFYTEKLGKSIREAGVRVWANALGDYDQDATTDSSAYKRFFRDLPFVNIVQTDQPKLLKQFLQSAKD